MADEKKHVPTISAGLDKRRELNGGYFNAALIVSFDYKRKYFHLTEGGTKIKLKAKDLRSRETKELFFEAMERAKQVIRVMPFFTWERFESKYFSDQFAEGSDLVSALRKYADSIPDSRLKTKIGYETVANVVEGYTKGTRVEMHEVTKEWLEAFESYLTSPYMKQTRDRTILKQGRTSTTVGIYLRNVRAVVIKWVKEEKPQNYNLPFGSAKDGLYQIPSSQNTKKALDFDDIAKFYHFELPVGTQIEFHRDLWLLSYMSNGMNMKDIARLRYRNIDIDKITFYRSKTIHTKRQKQLEVIVPLTGEIGRIIDKWKVPGSQEDFIFPILNNNMTARQELYKVQVIIKQVNHSMREIAGKLGIMKDVNTYSARHSFATIAMRKGFSVAQISKALGHTSTAITENYLGSFESSQNRQMADDLQDFKKFKQEQEKK